MTQNLIVPTSDPDFRLKSCLDGDAGDVELLAGVGRHAEGRHEYSISRLRKRQTDKHSTNEQGSRVKLTANPMLKW